MTVYELVIPMEGNKELVVGVYDTPDQVTSAIHSNYVCSGKDEVKYIIRKQNNEEYIQ